MGARRGASQQATIIAGVQGVPCTPDKIALIKPPPVQHALLGLVLRLQSAFLYKG